MLAPRLDVRATQLIAGLSVENRHARILAGFADSPDNLPRALSSDCLLNAALGRVVVVAAANHDDAALLGRGDAIEQSLREDEMAEVVDDELFLDAVHLLPVGQDDAGVEDQYVDADVR